MNMIVAFSSSERTNLFNVCPYCAIRLQHRCGDTDLRQMKGGSRSVRGLMDANVSFRFAVTLRY